MLGTSKSEEFGPVNKKSSPMTRFQEIYEVDYANTRRSQDNLKSKSAK